jgi:hypothetical protein
MANLEQLSVDALRWRARLALQYPSVGDYLAALFPELEARKREYLESMEALHILKLMGDELPGVGDEKQKQKQKQKPRRPMKFRLPKFPW